MLFTTDKQTLDDLNIAGISDVFNRCVTRGGAAMLEELFCYPLNDTTAINQRSKAIGNIMGMTFPFSSSLFDAIEPYLANADERTRLTAEQPLLARLIATDTLIHNGVRSLIALLKGLQTVQFEGIADLIPPLPETKHECDELFRFKQPALIKTILSRVYKLDMYISIANVAKERSFAFASPGQELTIRALYHPLVTNAVANDVQITDKNVVFLTGANMAGKSTFMKSLGIALFLAHMGLPVPATEMEFPVLDGIYTTINLPDNLGIGASHFYAEVLRVKKVAQELRHRKLFVVFDELFRGTNVKDAYEATAAITEAFAKKKNSLFVISTHIIEAGEVLQSPNIRFLYLPTRMHGTKPVYTYKLEEGITDDRHGMVIINNEGILKILNYES